MNKIKKASTLNEFIRSWRWLWVPCASNHNHGQQQSYVFRSAIETHLFFNSVISQQMRSHSCWTINSIIANTLHNDFLPSFFFGKHKLLMKKTDFAFRCHVHQYTILIKCNFVITINLFSVILGVSRFWWVIHVF